ncbi:Nudix family hydrolase [Parendozoicomonas sp. Alg238-R29]|uniref:Nudix family hydrolase n=1 Tax=Parendozoicomonas sp. Alg238-R29 TaxID=2993446 RepID=UPI00248F29E7|nr:Nudix family hydrolase [Parendozoicomonas sp. Alg238-R29]
MKRIHVAAAVILDQNNNILIARRPLDKHMGGLWEFPGGKVEPDEKVTDALCRELDEELGIRPSKFRPLIRIHHNYPDKSVLLDVWTVISFAGEAHGREGQPVKWVTPAELSLHDFPAANRPIVAAAQLPQKYLITGTFADIHELVSRVSSAVERQFSMIQFRAPWLSDSEYKTCVEALLPLFSFGASQLIVKGDLSWLDREGVAGLHMTSAQLQEWHEQGWSYAGEKLLIASCHNKKQLDMAAEVGASCTTLSPVQNTASHPDATPLGWEQAQALIEQAALPVYCLGGMSEESLCQAIDVGAQGVAAISRWW